MQQLPSQSVQLPSTARPYQQLEKHQLTGTWVSGSESSETWTDWEALVINHSDLVGEDFRLDVLDILASRGMGVKIGEGVLRISTSPALSLSPTQDVFVWQGSIAEQCGVLLQMTQRGHDLYIARGKWRRMRLGDPGNPDNGTYRIFSWLSFLVSFFFSAPACNGLGNLFFAVFITRQPIVSVVGPFITTAIVVGGMIAWWRLRQISKGNTNRDHVMENTLYNPLVLSEIINYCLNEALASHGVSQRDIVVLREERKKR